MHWGLSDTHLEAVAKIAEISAIVDALWSKVDVALPEEKPRKYQ